MATSAMAVAYQWLKQQRPDADGLRDQHNQLQQAYVCPPAVAAAPIPEELYPTSFVRDRAVDFLDSVKGDDRPSSLSCRLPKCAPSSLSPRRAILGHVPIPPTWRDSATPLTHTGTRRRRWSRSRVHRAQQRLRSTQQAEIVLWRAGGKIREGRGADLRHDRHDQQRGGRCTQRAQGERPGHRDRFQCRS